jgi:hypothetical protein
MAVAGQLYVYHLVARYRMSECSPLHLHCGALRYVATFYHNGTRNGFRNARITVSPSAPRGATLPELFYQ